MLAKLRFMLRYCGFCSVLVHSILVFCVFPSVPSGFPHEWPMSSHDSLGLALTPESPNQEATVRRGMTIYITDGTCSFTTTTPPQAARSGLDRGVVPRIVKPRLLRGVMSRWWTVAVLARVSAEVINTDTHIITLPVYTADGFIGGAGDRGLVSGPTNLST